MSTSAVVQPFVAEVQYITLLGDPTGSGFTFSLTFRGFTISASAVDSDIQVRPTALRSSRRPTYPPFPSIYLRM